MPALFNAARSAARESASGEWASKQITFSATPASCSRLHVRQLCDGEASRLGASAPNPATAAAF
jgi:hypothetical protein